MTSPTSEHAIPIKSSGCGCSDSCSTTPPLSDAPVADGQAGATVLVDGRDVMVAGREGGYYIGPTIIDHVTPEMRIAQEEVFGPVLAVLPLTRVHPR